ncbi:HAD hydrolase-like protein [Streptomyces sp. CBMA152]|uniref:HAD family hydrolase n=1 Tax=Streptomyces sp. CBMA152 TaxID=1896312 RepID=UPI00166182A9|nr:hypothetical protein [Streptomyces sp. CBMA152]
MIRTVAFDIGETLVRDDRYWAATEFFARVLEAAGTGPDETLYVGDHPANDLAPAHTAGLLTAHLRRGPWGYLWADTPEAATADWRVDSLHDVVRIVGG